MTAKKEIKKADVASPVLLLHYLLRTVKKNHSRHHDLWKAI